MPKQPLYLFVHIPKTGGQTLRNHFINSLSFHSEFVHLGPYGIEDAMARGLKPFADRPAARRRKARVVLGHQVDHQTHQLVPDRSPHYIVFLRDRAERMVSLYNFDMEYERHRKNLPQVPFSQWWGQRCGQTSVHWICHHFLGRNMQDLTANRAFDLAVETLDQFWFVGALETYREDTDHLMDAMKLPRIRQRDNVTGKDFPRRLTVDSRIRQRIYDDCPHDVALHKLFLKRSRRPHSKSQSTDVGMY